jgi:hypothetical protein
MSSEKFSQMMADLNGLNLRELKILSVTVSKMIELPRKEGVRKLKVSKVEKTTNRVSKFSSEPLYQVFKTKDKALKAEMKSAKIKSFSDFRDADPDNRVLLEQQSAYADWCVRKAQLSIVEQTAASENKEETEDQKENL